MQSSSFKAIIDRLEGDTAVIVLDGDDRVKFNLPVKYLPEGARGGDHLRVTLTQDEQSRDELKSRVQSLLDELKNSGK